MKISFKKLIFTDSRHTSVPTGEFFLFFTLVVYFFCVCAKISHCVSNMSRAKQISLCVSTISLQIDFGRFPFLPVLLVGIVTNAKNTGE